MPQLPSPIKDPWQTEHEIFLLHNPNAIAHSDTFYTGLVHAGFDADDTAVELIRRYPAFEEAEEHRKFLVRSLSERLVLSGETEDYFTPEQLWEEEERILGKGCFLESEEEEESDSEEEEEEEEEEIEHHQPFALQDNEIDLEPTTTSSGPFPISLQTRDHTTTITRDYTAIQLLLDSLEISHAVSPLRAITQLSADGSLVLALLGHLPIATTTTRGHRAAEKKAPTCCSDEWQLVSGPVAFFSGAETCSALVEEIAWAPESIVAASLVYGDGRVFVLVAGESVGAEEFGGVLGGVRRCEGVPAEHEEVVGLLEVARRDMVDLGGG